MDKSTEFSMLILLLKTRLHIYRNYIRHNFDRITKMEIGIIVLIFLLLLARSPADIGYNFAWLHSNAFTDFYLKLFPLMLILFYVVSKFIAYLTQKRTSEWQILGAQPFPRKQIIHFYLLRHFLKIGGFLLIIAFLFLDTMQKVKKKISY